jgi:hypothetical protein
MSAREAAEIEAFKLAEYGHDKEPLDFIEEWRETWGKLDAIYHGPSSREEVEGLLRKIDALEGQIVKHVPTTIAGMYKMLRLAAEIMAAKEIDDDCLKGTGPALALVCRVITGLTDHEQSCLRQRAAP